MKSRSKQILPSLGIAACLSILLVSVPDKAESGGGYPYVLSECDYYYHPAIPDDCGPSYYPVADCPLSPYSTFIVPIDPYCCLQYCYPPPTAERSAYPNESAPKDSSHEETRYGGARSSSQGQTPVGNTPNLPPSDNRLGPGSQSNRLDIIKQLPQQRLEDPNQVSSELEKESSLQGGWEIDDNSHDDHAGHDHDGHDHAGHDHDGHDHGYSGRK